MARLISGVVLVFASLVATNPATAGATAATAGSYSGAEKVSGSYTFTFYVATSGKQVQDVSLPTVWLTCTPGGSMKSDHISIPTIPISLSGAFTGKRTVKGFFTAPGGKTNFPATYTETFTGQITGTSPTGTFSEQVTYNNGTAVTCASGTQQWSATRDSQPVQTTAAPPPGYYPGAEIVSGQYPVKLYVSADKKSLQDVLLQTVVLGCTPGEQAPIDQITIESIPIKSGGAFSAVVTRSGVFKGSPATFKYTFNGHVHGTNSTPAERLAGIFREDVTYNNGAVVTCASNDQSWWATQSQPVQTSEPPPPGSYSGTEQVSGGYPLTLYVAGNGQSLQDISLPTVWMGCTAGGEASDHITIDSIPLVAGTFAFTEKRSGIFGGFPATFTYTFNGHAHGLNSEAKERLAGTFREEVAYNNGSASVTCSTNDRSWVATRDTQPAQTVEPPPPGSYSGTEIVSGAYPFTFSVANGGTPLQKLSMPTVWMLCTAGGEGSDHIAIETMTIDPSGSFFAEQTETRPFRGFAGAQFKSTFKGHFHATEKAGKARASGSFQEEVTYNNGSSTVTCTSNLRSWSAVHT